MYYSSFGALAIVLHFIINYDFLKKTSRDQTTIVRTRYRYFLFGIVLYYVSDVLWGMLHELRIVPLVYADTVLYFFSMVLSVLLWTRFVVVYLDVKKGFSRFLIYAGWAIFTYELIMLIVNFFIPVVFYFNEAGDYFPHQARYITLATQTLLFFISSVCIMLKTSIA